jgi:HSP20 family protein
MELITKLKNKIIPARRKPIENRDVLNLRDDINRIFDRFFFSPFERDGWARRIRSWDEDVMETSEGVVVRSEVSGVDPKDLEVELRGGALHIEAEQEDEWQQKDEGWHGYRYGTFHRVVPLPEGLDTSHATAVCKHGLLTVHIPWTTEARQRSRRITVDIE